jgi:hypothetical protein
LAPFCEIANPAETAWLSQSCRSAEALNEESGL